ncbi:hypothetical protein RF11_09949 [Thelohanellus kitauei]|uniref:Uncharacterized protein n=1 Tax=Thelohanellus kitauei TaxID=669202 RepID=A0A0C2JI56_THEKT|nr:hypothetical protein RF11_09949 [Thelohanellus kitauei]
MTASTQLSTYDGHSKYISFVFLASNIDETSQEDPPNSNAVSFRLDSNKELRSTRLYDLGRSLFSAEENAKRPISRYRNENSSKFNKYGKRMTDNEIAIKIPELVFYLFASLKLRFF